MKEIEVNGYDEAEHWAAINERNIYLSYTGENRENFMNHVHGSCELLLVVQGGADYTINNEVYSIREHDLLIIGAMDPHYRVITDFPFVRYGLTVLPAFLEALPILNEYANVYRTPAPADFSKLKHLTGEEYEQIRSLFLQIGEETTQVQSSSSDLVYALLLQLTIFLNRRLGYEKRDRTANRTYQAMLEIKSYIDLNYAGNLSLRELSSKFYLQPNTISKAFITCFGVHMKNYIDSVRITKAVGILETSSISITELALQVGYDSVNTFLRQFRAKMGLSPYQYRKKFLEYESGGCL